MAAFVGGTRVGGAAGVGMKLMGDGVGRGG